MVIFSRSHEIDSMLDIEVKQIVTAFLVKERKENKQKKNSIWKPIIWRYGHGDHTSVVSFSFFLIIIIIIIIFF